MASSNKQVKEKMRNTNQSKQDRNLKQDRGAISPSTEKDVGDKEMNVNSLFTLEIWKAQLQDRFEEQLREAKIEIENKLRQQFTAKERKELQEMEQTRKELEKMSNLLDETGANLSRRVKEFEEREAAFARRREAIANGHAAQLLRVESQARRSVEAATLTQDALYAQLHEKDVIVSQLSEKLRAMENSYHVLEQKSARYLVEGGEVCNAQLAERERQLSLATSALRETQLQLANRLDEIDRLRRENEIQERQLRLCQEQVEALTNKFNEVQTCWFARERALLDEQIERLERRKLFRQLHRTEKKSQQQQQQQQQQQEQSEEEEQYEEEEKENLAEPSLQMASANQPTSLASRASRKAVKSNVMKNNAHSNEVTSLVKFIQLLMSNPDIAHAMPSSIHENYTHNSVPFSSSSLSPSLESKNIHKHTNKKLEEKEEKSSNEHFLRKEEQSTGQLQPESYNIPSNRNVIFAERTRAMENMLEHENFRERDQVSVSSQAGDEALYAESISTPSTMRHAAEDEDFWKRSDTKAAVKYTELTGRDKLDDQSALSVEEYARVPEIESWQSSKDVTPDTKVGKLSSNALLPPLIPQHSMALHSAFITSSQARDTRKEEANEITLSPLRPLPDDFVRSTESGSSSPSTTRAEMLIFVEQLKRNRQKLLDTGVYTETHNVVKEMTEKIKVYEHYLANHLQ